MNFIEKLDMLMEKNHLNRSELSRRSGIPYSTISGLYEKGYDNIKLSTLKKLALVFKVSIDYMVFDDMPDNESDFNDFEISLIQKYRLLDDHGKYLAEILIDAEYDRCSSVPESSQLHDSSDKPLYYFDRDNSDTAESDSQNDDDVAIYRAANSIDNTDSEICNISKDHNMRLVNASETDENF